MSRAALALLALLAACLLACTSRGLVGHARTVDAGTPRPPVQDGGADPPPPRCPRGDAGCQTCAGDDDCARGECDDGLCRAEEEDDDESEEGDDDGPPEPRDAGERGDDNDNDNSGPGGGE